MSDKVFLVHGWAVDETTTYQALHRKLAQYGFDIAHINLGRYVSLDNDVEIRDIAKALHEDLIKDEFLGRPPWKDTFHIVTHSTGALVVKEWILSFYGNTAVEAGSGLRNLVFLAAPHFGSRLAHHGRSMLAHVGKLGDTGKKVLHALELGSSFSWDVNGAMLDPSTWKGLGIRPYSLIGDRVIRKWADRVAERVFPARYEEGSDMVVRVPSGNLNFRRYEFNAASNRKHRVAEIKDVPFAALASYVHSGEDAGIMNSITSRSNLRQQNLDLVVNCLRVTNPSGYASMRNRLDLATRRTRRQRDGFAQLDFRFRDEGGLPIDDYLIEIAYPWRDGRLQPSRAIVHHHKNEIEPSQFTLFIDAKEFAKELNKGVFMRFSARTHTSLVDFKPDEFIYEPPGRASISDLVRADHTTQIDIVLRRAPSEDLFVFHKADDPGLHVEWNRRGEVVANRLPWE